MLNIGFVGLGHMGLPMALNLIKAGFKVTGFDLQKDLVHRLEKSGGLACHSLAELANHNSILITMLQTGEQVKSVCLGEQGLFAHAKARTLFIDCSSIAVNNSREITQAANEKALLALDAPVSGGVAGAEAATLTFMVGGEDIAFFKAEPILNQLGKKIIRCGTAGSGQAAKICNNMILGISMVAISEAFIIAEKLGLSANKLFEVVSNSSGQCWAMSKYVPVPGILEQVPANNDYQPGFTAKMMLKDLALSQKAAQENDLNVPIAACATKLYQHFVDEGYGDLDFSGIIKMLSTS